VYSFSVESGTVRQVVMKTSLAMRRLSERDDVSAKVKYLAMDGKITTTSNHAIV